MSKKTEQTLRLFVSILVFVCNSYLFCDSCKYFYNYGESKSPNIVRVIKYVQVEYHHHTYC